MKRFSSGVAAVLATSLTLAGCGGGGSGSGLGSMGVSGSPQQNAQSVGSMTDDSTSSSKVTSNALTSAAATVALARQKIRHVFVIVQENHTFDQYFGLYPGTNGQYVENLGTQLAQAHDCEPDPATGSCQRPFLISANPNSPNYVPDAADINGGDNSRFGQESGIDHGKMDGFLAEDEGGEAPLGPTPSPSAIATHNENTVIEAAYDCDTIPYLWYYAKNFALYDHYFQGNTGPSSPGNVQLFAGQIGQTEAAAGVATVSQPVAGGSYSDGVPIANDDNPPQSNISFIANSYSPDNNTYQSYATMPVLLSPATDAAAVKAGVVGKISQDLTVQSKHWQPSYNWAWYEEGLYTGAAGFVAHHAAPLYFDYINNASSPFATQTTLRDNQLSNGLIADIQNDKLPSEGVFWVKGGVKNSYGLQPADPIFTTNSSGRQYYQGDDDHPGTGDGDHQVSEAYVAELVNAIAQSKYWRDSMIVLTWDDSGGFYDHVPPPSFGKTCPQDLTGPQAGYSCGDGVRLPTIVISPYAQTGVVVHNWADHGSVSKLIEAVFELPNFGQLPNESIGVREGLAPADTNPLTSDLLDSLDINKLRGWAPLVPATRAEIPNPSAAPTMSCATLGITPIKAPAPLPAGFATAGYYLHQSLEGTTPAFVKPEKNDSDD